MTEQLRRNADHCLKQAYATSDELQRIRWIRAAKTWQSLADTKHQASSPLGERDSNFHGTDFRCCFNGRVGLQRRPHVGFLQCKLGGCWIPVPLPPPVLPRSNFSAKFCRAEIANNRGLCAQTSALAPCRLEPKILSPGPIVSEPPHLSDLVRFS
jgi:hypothetical protein